jgi:hypothetical protein
VPEQDLFGAAFVSVLQRREGGITDFRHQIVIGQFWSPPPVDFLRMEINLRLCRGIASNRQFPS